MDRKYIAEQRARVEVRNPFHSTKLLAEQRRSLYNAVVQKSILKSYLRLIAADDSVPLYKEGHLVLLGSEVWIVVLSMWDLANKKVCYFLTKQDDFSCQMEIYESNLIAVDAFHAETCKTYYKNLDIYKRIEGKNKKLAGLIFHD